VIRTRRLPWVAMVVSVLSVPVLFVLASEFSEPPWDWATSRMGRSTPALLGLAFLGCVASPWLGGGRNGGRLGRSLLGGVAFVLAFAASLAYVVLTYGTPVR